MRVRHKMIGGVDEFEKLSRTSETYHHQYRAKHRARNPRGIYRGFEVGVLFCAEISRYYDGTTYVASECESNENQRNFIAVSHGRKGCVAYEFAGYETVGKIVELLENNTSEKREAKFEYNACRLSYC